MEDKLKMTLKPGDYVIFRPGLKIENTSEVILEVSSLEATWFRKVPDRDFLDHKNQEFIDRGIRGYNLIN